MAHERLLVGLDFWWEPVQTFAFFRIARLAREQPRLFRHSPLLVIRPAWLLDRNHTLPMRLSLLLEKHLHLFPIHSNPRTNIPYNTLLSIRRAHVTR
jgi:hypothetical protein